MDSTLPGTEVPPPALKPELEFTVHREADELWYAVRDPGGQKFIRLGRREFLVASNFDNQTPVDEVSRLSEQDCRDLSQPPMSVEEVKKLAGWLFRAGLLQGSEAAGTKTAMPGGPNPQSAPVDPKLASRLDLKVITQQFLSNPIYVRIPLLTGTNTEWIASRFAGLMHPFVLILWAILVGYAAVCVAIEWDTFTDRASNLFVADGRLWWLVAWGVLKIVHELGHAVIAVRSNVKIRSAGLAMIFFAPVPFIDISDLWSLPDRTKRIACSAGGMLAELGIASLGAIIALSVDTLWLQVFGCALAVTGTVTTLAFNANPLMRFDGYFILVDIINRPNLWPDSQQAMSAFCRRLLSFQMPSLQGSGINHVMLLCYGTLCWVYRIMISVTMALWAIIVWHGIGVALVLWASYGMFLSPMLKRLNQNKQACPDRSILPSLFQSIAKTTFSFLALLSVVVGLASVLPSPFSTYAPGVVVHADPTRLFAQSAGELVETKVRVGETVEPGQVLAVFRNPQLELERQLKQLQCEATHESIRVHRVRGELAKSQTADAQLASTLEQLAQLNHRCDQLVIRSPIRGRVVSESVSQQIGKTFQKGEALFLLSQRDELAIHAVAHQQQIDSLDGAAQVALVTAHQETVYGNIRSLTPRGSTQLEFPQLASKYGGPLALDLKPSGTDELVLCEPHFTLKIGLNENDSEDSRRLVPGENIWVKLPGSQTIFDSVRRWCVGRWEQFERESQKTAMD